VKALFILHESRLKGTQFTSGLPGENQSAKMSGFRYGH
jgi:hypothetical protein